MAAVGRQQPASTGNIGCHAETGWDLALLAAACRLFGPGSDTCVLEQDQSTESEHNHGQHCPGDNGDCVKTILRQLSSGIHHEKGHLCWKECHRCEMGGW